MPSSSQFIYEVLEHQKTDLLIHLLLTEADLPSLLVILRTKEALHAVTAALANPNRVVRKIWGTREALSALDLPPVLPIVYADVAIWAAWSRPTRPIRASSRKSSRWLMPSRATL